MNNFKQNLQNLFQNSILNNLQSENVVTIIKLIAYWYEKDQRNREIPEFLVFKNEISDEFTDSENLVIKELASQILKWLKLTTSKVTLDNLYRDFEHLDKKFIDEALTLLYNDNLILVNRQDMSYTLKPTIEERKNKIIEELNKIKLFEGDISKLEKLMEDIRIPF